MQNKRRGFLGALLTVALVAFFASLLFLSAQAQTSSGDEYNSETASVYTDELLSLADIELGEYDRVIRTDSDGSISLSVVRAFEVQVDYRGERFTGYSTGGTVEEAIASAGITLTGAEEVIPSLDAVVQKDTVIIIKADSTVTLTADGETETYITKGGTVEELLSDLGIKLSQDDIVTPSLNTRLQDDMEICVQRIEYREETATEVIDYGFVSKETSSLTSGTSKIEQYGIEGERSVLSRNKYVDGVLVESVVISEEVTREPQDQIKLIGIGVPKTQSNSSSNLSQGASVSNKAGTFTDASGNTVSYTKKLTGTSTAYYAAEGAITATGVPVYLGGVAVNPNVIPYGSKLYIVSSDGSVVYGYATAVDTGGALMSGSVLVDVFFPTYNQCINWGRRNVTVYVLS